MRMQLSFAEPAQQLRQGLVQQIRLSRLIGAPVEANDADVFDQYDVGGNLGNASGSEANNKETPLPCDRAQSSVEGVAADGIIYNISAAAAGDLFDALTNVFARIADQEVGVVLSRNLELLRASSAGNHARAHGFADLNGGESPAACC